MPNSSGINAEEVATDLVIRQQANGILHISGLNEGEMIRVYDLSGRIMLTEKSQDDTTEINLTQFSKGVYIVNINNKRIIKIQVR